MNTTVATPVERANCAMPTMWQPPSAITLWAAIQSMLRGQSSQARPARRLNCNKIRATSTATLGSECGGIIGGTTTYVTDAANATNDATSAAVVGTAGCAAVDDATAADANDGTAATNVIRDETYDGAYETSKHDGAAAVIRRVESVRTDLLTGRGGFYSKLYIKIFV